MANELFDDDPAPATPSASGDSSASGVTGKGASGGAKAGKPKAAGRAAIEETPAEAFASESSSEPGGAAPLMAAPTSPEVYASPALPERIADARSKPAEPTIFMGEGLTFERRFTKEGEDVFDTTEWEYRTAAITGERGEVVFEQKDCEIPKSWSMLATNVVVSKYFRGKVGTPQRETSVKQLVSRVADTIVKWGRQGNYFADEKAATAFHDELKYLLLHQYMAFNSPVWFNLGVPGERPQVSACQPYHALVSTPQGLIPIGKLVEDRAIGTVVYDASGTTRVVAVKANGRKNVLRLHTKAGYTLDVTPDHLVWKRTGGGKAPGKFCGKFVEAGTLKPGDRLTWHRTPLTGKADQDGTAEAEAALAGWLQSDGFVGQYTGTNRSLTIEAMVVNADEEAWVRSAISHSFPEVHSHTRPVETQSADLDCKRIRLYGENLRSFIEKWGLMVRGTDMNVPSALFTAPYSVAAAYLRSLFQAEGYVILRDNAGIGLDMISEEMVRGVQRLLLRFGIYARVRYKADSRTDRKGCWSLSLKTLGDRKRFAQEIGFIGEAKQEKLLAGLDRKGLDLAPVKQMEIERIEDLGEMEVFDIQTESGEYLSGNLRVHNCFINSVDDTMESILTLAKTEGMLFKWGSGTGTNFSVLRSSKEGLKGGGTASGPVSFMRGFDSFAGAIKSGGKTRRAAKMVILNADHPDIEEFVECKADAEKKAHALIEAGYSGMFNVPNGAYDSVYFQNANHSVRATDDFMRAVELDRDWTTVEVLSGKPSQTYRARDLMKKISEAAWVCGDPGMQFDTTANRWHTCPNTSRINASNPCVTGDTLVATTEGWQRIDALVGQFAQVYGADGQPHFVTNIFPTGTKQVYRLRTRAGFELRLTADHKVLTANRGDVPASELKTSDRVTLQGAGFGRRALGERLALAIGVAVGDGCLTHTRQIGHSRQDIITLVMAEEEAAILEKIAGEVNEQKFALKTAGSAGRNDGVTVNYTFQTSAPRLAFSSQPVVNLFTEFAILDEGSDRKRFTPAIYELDRASLAGVLRGLFTADGTVANYGEKSQYIALDSTSLEMLRQVQMLLLSFGIKAKLYTERRGGASEAILPDGRGGSKSYYVKEMHSLRISRSSRFVFEREIGFDPDSPKAAALAEMNRAFGSYCDTMTDEVVALEPLGEESVYDLTEPVTSHFVANGIIVHNCSEYFFIDDSACNLASLNLMRFRTPNREFDVETFKHAVRVTITAMEIMVGYAAYPTDKITVNSFDYRPLGLGYANLGALLMARGVPYDSDEGRAYAAAITAILSGEGYNQSASIARRVGPFAGYERNRQPFLRVMQMHRDHVEAIQKEHVPDDMVAAARSTWDAAIENGQTNGYRNAQISVLAPTGTIGFLMDCDTTGVEPDIAIVKYKNLVGGGMFKIVNQTVPEALERLGYSASERKAILDYIEANDTIEGAPGLAEEHLPVFDCAFRARSGTRSIHYMGHIKMMAAVQPFLSGAISKTVNMPHEATPDDITEAYMQAWKMGVKALAIYRDGSKKTQPLSTGRGEEKPEKKAEARPLRRKLPDERQSLTHKFSVGGHEGYLTIGMYPDNTPGEIFITMSKEGSVVSGLMDSFATSISLALQYGVPLKTLVDKFMHTRFEPSGFTGNPDIPMAKSIMDYLFRYLALKFLDKDSRGNVGLLADQDEYGESEPEALPVRSETAPVTGTAGQAGPAGQPSATGESRTQAAEKQVFVTQADAPPCPDCGSITTRNGACYRCANCGTSIGCS